MGAIVGHGNGYIYLMNYCMNVCVTIVVRLVGELLTQCRLHNLPWYTWKWEQVLMAKYKGHSANFGRQLAVVHRHSTHCPPDFVNTS
jgi:hypothetical protein